MSSPFPIHFTPFPSRLMRSAFPNRSHYSGAVRMFYWLRSHVGMNAHAAHRELDRTFN